ncbi:hypothetical protein MRX96_005587 [Rhipicephalus microplus]
MGRHALAHVPATLSALLARTETPNSNRHFLLLLLLLRVRRNRRAEKDARARACSDPSAAAGTGLNRGSNSERGKLAAELDVGENKSSAFGTLKPAANQLSTSPPSLKEAGSGFGSSKSPFRSLVKYITCTTGKEDHVPSIELIRELWICQG